MTTCPNCGRTITDNSQYCGQCGTRLFENQQNIPLHLSKLSTSEDILKTLNSVYMPRFLKTSKSYDEIEAKINNPQYNLPHNPPASSDELKVWDWLTRVELCINNYAKSNQLINDAFYALLKISSEDISMEQYSKASLEFTNSQIMSLLKINSDAYKLLLDATKWLRLSIKLVLDK